VLRGKICDPTIKFNHPKPFLSKNTFLLTAPHRKIKAKKKGRLRRDEKRQRGRNRKKFFHEMGCSYSYMYGVFYFRGCLKSTKLL